MWKYTLREITRYVQIKVSEKQNDALQNFEVLTSVLSLAFGGDKDSKETKINNKNQLQLALNKMKK